MWALEIWRNVQAPMELRWQAFQWLSDRGMGKPVSMVEINAHVREVRTPRDLSALSDDDLEQIDQVFRKALDRPKVIDVPPSSES